MSSFFDDLSYIQLASEIEVAQWDVLRRVVGDRTISIREVEQALLPLNYLLNNPEVERHLDWWINRQVRFLGSFGHAVMTKGFDDALYTTKAPG
jgi:hypothetical protein